MADVSRAGAQGTGIEAQPPVVLIIRDGWGENPNPSHDAFNAVKLARTPVDDRLRREWPMTLVKTCGEDVGLPAGTMGNSEVGHQNIGAGRIVDQELMRITRAIRDGSFFTKPAFLAAFEHARRNRSKVHLMGLVSNGQVHSDLEHLFALIDLAKAQKVAPGDLLIHVFTDGRDTPPQSGLGFVKQLEAKLGEAGVGRIATVIGRYFSMDRDHRWDRIAWAYRALTGREVAHPGLAKLVCGAGGVTAGQPAVRTARSATEAIERAYAHPADPSRGGDEFVEPTRIVDARGGGGEPIGLIGEKDAVIFFNFRGDRPRELTKAFVLDDAAWGGVTGALPNGAGGFERGRRIDNLFYCTMCGYEAGLPVSAIAFDKPPKMPGILGQVVSEAGLTQFRCAETEKFPHVTFFFNDYREQPFAGESRLLVPSPRDVATYDLKPEMSAEGVCDGVLARLRAKDCEALIVVNFANADMVGHTGKLEAASKAVEAVDACVGRIVEAALAVGGTLVITADHGNAEQMWDPVHNTPHTAHTVYDVPLFVVGEGLKGRKLRGGGRLADIAPTVLALMGLGHPAAMTGGNLVV